MKKQIFVILSIIVSSVINVPAQHFRKSNDDVGEIKVKAITVLPLYKIVDYFTNRTQEMEAKVQNLAIPQFMYYTHLYLAWKNANPLMSSIAVRTQNGDDDETKLRGANLVLELNKLEDMFAPGIISPLLDFVQKCYYLAKPMGLCGLNNQAYISTLRASDNAEINEELLRHTAKQFMMATPYGSYHLVWENSTMEKFMSSLNYEKFACGGDDLEQNPCDWRQMGLSSTAAKSQCLYRLVNGRNVKKTSSLCIEIK